MKIEHYTFFEALNELEAHIAKQPEAYKHYSGSRWQHGEYKCYINSVNNQDVCAIGIVNDVNQNYAAVIFDYESNVKYVTHRQGYDDAVSEYDPYFYSALIDNLKATFIEFGFAEAVTFLEKVISYE